MIRIGTPNSAPNKNEKRQPNRLTDRKRTNSSQIFKTIDAT